MLAHHSHDQTDNPLLQRPDLRWVGAAAAATLVSATWWTLDLISGDDLMDRNVQGVASTVLAILWCAALVRCAERRINQRIERLAAAQQVLVEAEDRRKQTDARAEAVVDELSHRRRRDTGRAAVPVSGSGW